MPYPTCRHVMENGYFCQSPAVSKRDYCYFHIEFRGRRMKMARARARGERWWLDLPAIEDMRSCQAATVRVIEAIAAQLIEPAYAKLLLSSLRLAAGNFKARPAWSWYSDYNTNGTFEFVGDYPGFEAFHDLPKELDLDEDPLKVFPMPPTQEPVPVPLAKTGKQKANGETVTLSDETGAPLNPAVGLSARSSIADILKKAETPVPGTPMHVTADDVEVWDVMNREGEKAALQRAAELERNRQRRQRRIERLRYEELARNRNIQLAAQKLIADQQRQAASSAAQGEVPATPASAVASSSGLSVDTQRKPPQTEGARAETKAAQRAP